MPDPALTAHLVRIERRLTAILLLLGLIATIGLLVMVDQSGSGLVVLALLFGTAITLLLTYITAAVLTPGQPTTGRRGEPGGDQKPEEA